MEVGDPRRFRSADAFAAYTGTAPIPASSAETRGHPVHHRLSRFGNRRLNSVLYGMALVRQRVHPETQAYTARLLAAGKTPRDAQRIVKRRLARLVWQTMMRDLQPSVHEFGRGRGGRPGGTAPGERWRGLVRGRTSHLRRCGGGASPAGAERSGAAERGEA